jgi:threonine synthase
MNKNTLHKNSLFNMFRYTPLLPIKSVPYSTLNVGWTPLYSSNKIGRELGLEHLFIKDEGVNPTASLKDRASVIACLKAIEQKADTICCSSTGNAASSLAGNAARLGLKALIFVPERAPLGKLSQMLAYGANVVKIKGDYKDTFDASKEAIDIFKLYNRNAAINPNLVEGKKTVALEIAEQLNFEEIDTVFVSVGDGCTIYSVYKAFYDLVQLEMIPSIPKIVGVQASGCSPFYNAWKTNTTIQETEENTIADSIAVGIPRNPVKGLKAVTESNGYYMTVTDKEILDASYKLARGEGIFAEPAGATALAGLIKAVANNKINKDAKVVIIVTGNGLKDATSLNDTVTKEYHVNKNQFIDYIKEHREIKIGNDFKKIMQDIQKKEETRHE